MELSSSAAHTRRVRHSALVSVSRIILDCGVIDGDLDGMAVSAYHVDSSDLACSSDGCRRLTITVDDMDHRWRLEGSLLTAVRLWSATVPRAIKGDA
jgi:hypothetical protein